MKETGLSHAHVADDDVLEDVGVVVWTSRHCEVCDVILQN